MKQLWFLFTLLVCVEQNRNRSSIVLFALYGNFAVMVLHRVLDDGQTKPGTTRLLGMALIDAVESLKHLVLMLGSNADAGILDTQSDTVIFLGNKHLHASIRVIVLDGVVAKVIDHLIEQAIDAVYNTIISGYFKLGIEGVAQFAFGGTSIIIVIGVALETIRELEAQMTMRNYKGFLD